jgi:O-antigen ligase
LLGSLALPFAYAVVNNGGVETSPWLWAALAISVLTTFYWLSSAGSERPPDCGMALLWPAIALPGYVGLQIVPLPVSVLRAIAPARAHLVEAVAVPAPPFAPLSVAPAASLEHWLRIAVYIMIFLAVRELAWHLRDHPWWPVFPIILVAACQAALGLAQVSSGADVAQGTYVNRDHYAGLLEMALPYAAAYPFAVFGRTRASGPGALRTSAFACAGIAIAALILLGSVYSFSRMGYTAAFFSLLLMGAGLLARTARLPRSGMFRNHKIALSLYLILIILAFLWLAPGTLIARFSEDPTDRVHLWKETLALVAAYPLFGSGLGTYESAFAQYKASYPTLTDPFAHNDYLQFLAELGAIGFAIAAALVVGAAWSAAKAVRRHPTAEGRALAVACMASLGAILLHSTVDFNLYTPANAVCLAWTCGLATSVMFSSISRPLFMNGPRISRASYTFGR